MAVVWRVFFSFFVSLLLFFEAAPTWCTWRWSRCALRNHVSSTRSQSGYLHCFEVSRLCMTFLQLKESRRVEDLSTISGWESLNKRSCRRFSCRPNQYWFWGLVCWDRQNRLVAVRSSPLKNRISKNNRPETNLQTDRSPSPPAIDLTGKLLCSLQVQLGFSSQHYNPSCTDRTRYCLSSSSCFRAPDAPPNIADGRTHLPSTRPAPHLPINNCPVGTRDVFRRSDHGAQFGWIFNC